MSATQLRPSRRFQLIAALLAIIVLSLSIPAETFAIIVDTCSAGTQKNMHVAVSVGGGTFDGVIGESQTRMLTACTSPTATKFSFPLVVGVTMELDGTRLVQLGLIRCELQNGQACNGVVPNDDKVHFWYTAADNTSGLIALADGWAGGAPTLGHRYRYNITSEAGRWEMCIRDVTAGTGYLCEPGGITQHWSESDLVWWGTEVQNTSAAMGYCWCNGAQPLNMYWMQYSNPANPNWILADNLPITRTNQPHPARWDNFTWNHNSTKDALESNTHPF